MIVCECVYVSLQACLCFNVTLQCICLILYVELRSDNFH